MSVVYRVEYAPKSEKSRMMLAYSRMEFATKEGAVQVRAAILYADPSGDVKVFRVTHGEVEIK